MSNNTNDLLERQLRNTPLENGLADRFHIQVSEITLTAGSVVIPAEVGVTVIVGPNNSGKSTLLRELKERLYAHPGSTLSQRQVVQGVRLSIGGTPADAVAWLRAHYRYQGEPRQGFVPVNGDPLIDGDWLRYNLENHLNTGSNASKLGALAPFVVHYANTEARLRQSHAAPVRDNATEPAVHPVHMLSENRQLLDEISEVSCRVFGDYLVLDDYSAANRLRVGRPATTAPRRDEDDSAYRNELLALPELQAQGDGMRSFLGLLLPLITSRYGIVLVDEPEAFLHPPQASELGRQLGRITQGRGLQLILATHNRHLLAGLLESKASLSIVRIDRRAGGAHAEQIAPESLQEVWSEPALRYSSALDGLFHKLVVLVEAEQDAQFYSAALGAAFNGGHIVVPPSEVLFVPCGGKGGIAKLALTLKQLGVRVAAMPDLDVLRAEAETRRIVEALGGSWSDYESDYKSAVSSASKKAEALHGDIISGLISEYLDKPIPEKVRKRIISTLKVGDDGWNAIKAGGMKALGAGGTGAAARRLDGCLREIGFVLVEVGELESYGGDLDVAKGPAWLREALASDVHKSEDALKQIVRLIGAFDMGVA